MEKHTISLVGLMDLGTLDAIKKFRSLQSKDENKSSLNQLPESAVAAQKDKLKSEVEPLAQKTSWDGYPV